MNDGRRAVAACGFCLRQSAAEVDRLNPGARLLLIGAPPDGLEVPSTLECDRIATADGPDDLERCGRYELAVVLALGPRAGRTAATRLLARLRDVHALRALVCARGLPGLGFAEMLALGFERHVSGDGDAAVYLYDRDRYNESREWNSPENWANPDNFERYRW